MSTSQSIGDVVETLIQEFPEVSISKVRYLESRGLITPDRAPSGYRRYSDEHVGQLRWVLQQQRDHFLPLRVIKEKLSTGDYETADSGQLPAKKRKSAVSALTKPSVALDLSADDLLERAGIDATHLADLERFGMVNPAKSRQGKVYGGDDLLVAKLAARFLDHGVEPRHLRPWKLAIDREAGLVDQRLASVGDDPADRRAAVEDFVSLADDLRSVLLRQALADEI